MALPLARLVGVLPNAPYDVATLEKLLTRLKKDHTHLQIMNLDITTQGIFTEGEMCYCMTCDAERREELARVAPEGFPFSGRFIVCPKCGNKRCPRATLHSNDCTGSNEPGQDGSAYGPGAGG